MSKKKTFQTPRTEPSRVELNLGIRMFNIIVIEIYFVTLSFTATFRCLFASVFNKIYPVLSLKAINKKQIIILIYVPCIVYSLLSRTTNAQHYMYI